MRTVKIVVALVVLLAVGAFCTSLCAPSAFAQTVVADRFRLNTGPCSITSTATGPKLILETCPDVTTPAATNLTLSPTGDLVTNPTGNDVLPDVGYDINLGTLQKKYLTLHAAELWVETLVAQNTIATIGGRVLVGPTTTLTTDLGTGDTSIVVKHNQMANGDRVYMEADGKVEFMAITSAPSGTGPYTYTVTRNLDGSGANQWYAGDAVFNTGTTGDGFIDLYSVQGVDFVGTVGPTIVGNVRLSSTYSDWAPRWAIGNLNAMYGYGVDTYGAAFGDAAATNVTVDATNGFRIRNATTNKFVADTSGNLSIVGDLSVGTAGVIRSNKTACATGTGWWMSYNGGTPEFCIGNPAANRLTWDGSTLTIVGDGGGVTNINGASIQTGTVSAAKLTIGAGRNLIRNSDCLNGTVEWELASTTGLGETLAYGHTTYDLNDEGGGCYTQSVGTPANGTAIFLTMSYRHPVLAGNKYEASAYLGVHSAGLNAYVALVWYDSAGAYLSQSNGNNCEGGGAGGTLLTSFCRSAVVATAPTNAEFVRLSVQRIYDGVGSNQATFLVHAYLGEALINQTEFTPWGPGGYTTILGGHIQTDTITATQIAANAITTSELNADSVTSAKIAAGTIVASDIAAGTITADRLSVSTLSAITANLGTVTAGTINLGSVSIDSSGFELTAGAGSEDRVRWSNGAYIGATTSNLILNSNVTGGIDFLWSGCSFYSSTTNLAPGCSGMDLGTSTTTFDNLWLDGNAQVGGLSGTGTDYVCVDADGTLTRSDSGC